MGTTRKSPVSLELQRKQLDARLTQLPTLEPPRGGWIRTIRRALGMTLEQLGRRLGASAPAVHSFESREVKETISIGKLRLAAEALGCDLKIVFVPKPSLDTIVKNQATLKAREERDQLIHTMHLEGQDAGVHDVLDERVATDRWLQANGKRLWD